MEGRYCIYICENRKNGSHPNRRLSHSLTLAMRLYLRFADLIVQKRSAGPHCNLWAVAAFGLRCSVGHGPRWEAAKAHQRTSCAPHTRPLSHAPLRCWAILVRGPSGRVDWTSWATRVHIISGPVQESKDDLSRLSRRFLSLKVWRNLLFLSLSEEIFFFSISLKKSTAAARFYLPYQGKLTKEDKDSSPFQSQKREKDNYSKKRNRTILTMYRLKTLQIIVVSPSLLTLDFCAQPPTAPH